MRPLRSSSSTVTRASDPAQPSSSWIASAICCLPPSNSCGGRCAKRACSAAASWARIEGSMGSTGRRRASPPGSGPDDEGASSWINGLLQPLVELGGGLLGEVVPAVLDGLLQLVQLGLDLVSLGPR